MRAYDEKRDYNRLNIHCEISYRLIDQENSHQGYCTSISGAGLSFLVKEAVEVGKALEINVSSSNKSNTPSLIAFIETIRSDKLPDGHFEISAAIKGIKAEQ